LPQGLEDLCGAGHGLSLPLDFTFFLFQGFSLSGGNESATFGFFLFWVVRVSTEEGK